MRKHTTIDLDMDLIREAGAALGTARVTDTVHAALDDVVRRRRRMEFLALQPGIDLADLGRIRSHRFAEVEAPYGKAPHARRRQS